MKYEEGAACLSTSTTSVKVQQARKTVPANRRVLIDKVVCSMEIDHASNYDVTCD